MKGRATPGATCSVPGCGKPFLAKGVCREHYHGLYRYGDPTFRLKGKKGLGSINHNGYRIITVGGKQILEHRYVMEQILGRLLRSEENVHHLNGQRADNRRENLELWSKSQPPGQRVVDKLKWAREIISLYGALDQP